MAKKVVVITGASSGIGAALAFVLGKQEYRLVLAARRENELRRVAEQCGTEAIPFVCDVTSRTQVNQLREKALGSYSHVDVWINNAGQGIARSVMDVTDEDLDTIFNVNLKSALYGMQAIVPHFQERGEGHLINVSSFLGRVPLVPFRSAYNAAKAGLNALTANLRVDLAVKFPCIHVSLVMPGIVSTDFGRNALGVTSPAVAPGTSPAAQSAEEVAQIIAKLIEDPKPEIYTNPVSHGIAQRYYEDVGAFERAARSQS